MDRDGGDSSIGTTPSMAFARPGPPVREYGHALADPWRGTLPSSSHKRGSIISIAVDEESGFRLRPNG
jgi:hypothetical protein